MRTRGAVALSLAGAVLVALVAASRRLSAGLDRPELLTGTVLAVLMLGLWALNMKKRLAMFPLGTSAFWLDVHVAGGLLAAGAFWVHTQGRFWPEGATDRLLAGAFYLVTLSGVLGYFLQKIYPPYLASHGVEVIFERIPEELARLREESEALVVACAAETGSSTLARLYSEELSWYFRRPRFLLGHVAVSDGGAKWVRRRVGEVSRFLDASERPFHKRLLKIAYHKNDLDFHFAAQGLMKGWLLAHVPLAVATVILAAWHIFKSLVYAI